MKNLFAPLAMSVASLVVFAQAEAPQDYRFKVEKLLEGIPQPMELEIAPDGRIFFNEYSGRLKIYHPATKQVVEAGKIEVFTGQENGFPASRWTRSLRRTVGFIASIRRRIMRGNRSPALRCAGM